MYVLGMAAPRSRIHDTRFCNAAVLDPGAAGVACAADAHL